ncbi:MAG: hypothetical protein QW407_04740 [Thermofilaceae archaeon]
MPDPVVTHVIGTIALAGAAVLMLAAFTFLQYVNYMDSVNLMLAEAAESAARSLVEIVSVYTLGGAGVSYMTPPLPETLAGQPYLLYLSGGGDNVLNVTARLQIYRQVRVVVMPNFGRYPVRAVRGSVPRERFQGRLQLDVSDTLLLPLPPGYRPAIVVFRSSDDECQYPSFDPVEWRAICVAFAAVHSGRF